MPLQPFLTLARWVLAEERELLRPRRTGGVQDAQRDVHERGVETELDRD